MLLHVIFSIRKTKLDLFQNTSIPLNSHISHFFATSNTRKAKEIEAKKFLFIFWIACLYMGTEGRCYNSEKGNVMLHQEYKRLRLCLVDNYLDILDMSWVELRAKQ